jgi:hypothetical protein
MYCFLWNMMENVLYGETIKELCRLAPAGIFFWMVLHIRKKKRETGRTHRYIEGHATSIILDTDTQCQLGATRRTRSFHQLPFLELCTIPRATWPSRFTAQSCKGLHWFDRVFVLYRSFKGRRHDKLTSKPCHPGANIGSCNRAKTYVS